jgi:hypothetical protein
MNTRILATIVCLTLLGEYAYSQNAPDPKGKNNAVSGLFPPPFNQWNKFPNWGNAGIGTTSPSEKLEVIGNVKISQIIFTHALESSTYINSGTLNLSGNGIVNGNLGLGVPSPTERLDVLGNIKLSGNLSAQGLNIQTLNSNGGIFNTITVTQNSIFNGLSSFNENVSFAKDVVITGKLETGPFTASGLASFSEDVSFAKDLSISGKLGIGVPSPSESLDINGNLKLTGSINAAVLTAEQGTFNQGLNAGNTVVNGSLQVSGPLTSQSISLNDINASNNASIGRDLTVTGVSQLNGGATITGNGSVSGDLVVSGTLNAANLSISQISTNGSANVSQDLTVLGQSQLGGNLNVTGDIKAGVIEGTEFRMTGGGSPFSLENAIISQTLSVGADRAVPSNYKLAVGGNIIATGIDIKIPQKWPDYVFTDGYKLLTIEEVKIFIEKNGHLPNVLSAKEMQEQQNYNVAEMDRKLMEKVEELTLYIIQLQEKIKKLEDKESSK